MQPNNTRLRRSRLSAALLAALLLPAAGMAFAQDTGNSQSDNQNQEEQRLEKIVVTGSLIPQSQIETFKPTTTITAEAIASRGYTDVQDVLAQASFATGATQGAESNGAVFTKGAQTVSMFGLPPGFTKYLIDGVPMVSYPALYNGSDIFNNISGIPTTLVQRIDILPGGQSSLYGSDAIAGVINIVLKDHLEGGEVGVRYGWYQEGGGESKRLSFAYGDTSGDFQWLAGAQWEKTEPVWAYQRDLTSDINTEGYNDPVASLDVLIYSFGNTRNSFFFDPNDCNNITGLWDGTMGKHLFVDNDGWEGAYCGTYHSGQYKTVLNGKDSKQVYLHGTYDMGGGAELYGTLLYNHERVQYRNGAQYSWWGSASDFGIFYDPRLEGNLLQSYGLPGSLVAIQRAFTPEAFGPGGFKAAMSTNFSDSYMARVGVRGDIGDSPWRYNVNVGRSEYKLTQGAYQRVADKINGWFQENVLGPQLGTDPYFGYAVYTPNYEKLYQPINPATLWGWMDWAENKSKTYNNLFRAKLTNGYLFSLPGGDAGLAVVAEYANKGWDYNPDPRLLAGEFWGNTGVAGEGTRDRYAFTGEFRMPLFDMLTLTASARYDHFKSESPDFAGNERDATTYGLGVEFRPFKTLLIRGKYGTAFKAPSMSDLYQKQSGFYTFVPDFYRCWTEFGIDPQHITECSANSVQVFATQIGNPDLDPIEADVWNAGIVWAPTARLSFSVDYYHWEIQNMVTNSSGSLLFNEYLCARGELDPSSMACQQADSQIIRNSRGELDQINAIKYNIASQKVAAITIGADYLLDAGSLGNFRFSGSYTNMQKHELLRFPGDPVRDLLNDPFYGTDPKVKGNASVTWQRDLVSATVYANYIGHTPNNSLNSVDRWDQQTGTPGMLDPWWLYSLSIAFHPTDDLDVALRVSNVLNSMPDMDVANYSGSSSTPYNMRNFSVMGRRYYIQANWRFGDHGG